jgi:hypothetical protein
MRGPSPRERCITAGASFVNIEHDYLSGIYDDVLL